MSSSAVAEVVDEDLLGEGEPSAEPLAAERGPLREPAVDLLDELDGGGGGDLRWPWREYPLRCPVLDTSIGQVREIRYQEIADDLRRRVERGEFAAGRLLPSESELSGAYAASRITIREALEVLRDEGLVDSPAGLRLVRGRRPAAPVAGPARHDRGASWRLRGRARSAGSSTSASCRPRPGPARCSGATTVLEVRRLNLADGEPFARVTVWCPDDLGAPISRDDVERSSFYELLEVPLGGAVQTIGAALAAPDDAALLEVPVGSPVLRCERITSTPEGRPVLLSEHVFPAHRTEFVVDLPLRRPEHRPQRPPPPRLTRHRGLQPGATVPRIGNPFGRFVRPTVMARLSAGPDRCPGRDSLAR